MIRIKNTMKHLLSVLISACFLTTCVSKGAYNSRQDLIPEYQVITYKLIESKPRSDLNYKLLNDFNNSVKRFKGKELKIIEIFKPVDGCTIIINL